MRPRAALGVLNHCCGSSGLRALAKLTRPRKELTVLQVKGWKLHEPTPGNRHGISQEEAETILRESWAGKSFCEIARLLVRARSPIQRTFYRHAGLAWSTEIDEISRLGTVKTIWAKIGGSPASSISRIYKAYRRHIIDDDATDNQNSGAAWPSAAIKQLIHTRHNLRMPRKSIALVMNRTEASVTERYHQENRTLPRGPPTWTSEKDLRPVTSRGEKSFSWKDARQALPVRTLAASRRCSLVVKSSGPFHSRSFSTAVPLVNHHHRASTNMILLGSTGSPRGGVIEPFPRRIKADHQRRFVHTPVRVTPFGEEENKIIVQRRRELVSFPDIATELKRPSVDSVRSQFYRLVARGEPGKIRRRLSPLSVADYDDIAHKRAAGVPWPDIGPVYDRTAWTCMELYNQHNKHRLQPHLKDLPKRLWNKAEISELFDRRDRLGQSWPEIADRLHRSQKAVYSKYGQVKLDGKADQSRGSNEYSSEEDHVICYLREFLGLAWKEVHLRLSKRSVASLRRRYHGHLAPRSVCCSDKASSRFARADYALLHDLHCKQQLHWDAVQEKMPNWTIKDLQDRHALLIKWPPSSTSCSSLLEPRQTRKFTTVTESSTSYFGTRAKKIQVSARNNTFGTSTIPLRGQSRCYNVSSVRHPPPSLHCFIPSDMHLVHRGATFGKPQRIRCIFTLASKEAAPPVPEQSRNRPFDDAEVEIIIKRREEGKSYPEIAMEIGRPIPSVASKFRWWAAKTGQEHLIRRKSRVGRCDHRTIKEMKNSGMSWHEIATKDGRTAAHLSAYYHLQEATLALEDASALKSIPRKPSLHRKPFSDNELKILMHDRDVLKNSWAEIGQQLGRSPWSVRTKYHSTRSKGSVNRPSSLKRIYSQEELSMLADMRNVQKLPWKTIQLSMPERSIVALADRLKRMNAERQIALQASKSSGQPPESEQGVKSGEEHQSVPGHIRQHGG